MIQFIVGKKGSGKTKALLAQTNEAAHSRQGNVVFIDKNKDYLYEVNHRARFIDVSEYAISNADAFYGFLAGLAASDFDLDVVYVDAFLKIAKAELADLEGFFQNLEMIATEHKFDMVFSVSIDPADVPEFAKGYIQA